MTRPGWVAHLGDQAARAALGRRIETLTEEVFQVLRWSIMVGLARFMSISTPGALFTLVHWGLAGLLFAYLVSRFLLRPELRLFGPDASRAQRLAQSVVNLAFCVLAFAAVLWAVNALADAASAMQGAPRNAPY